MADTIAQDVVNQSQSVGDLTPSDAAATTTTTNSNPLGDVDGIAEGAAKENGLHAPTVLPDLEDVSAKSDTDGSRAEGSVAGDKPAEAKPIKKFTPAKPVFAKYSVPKVIAANATSKGLDKATTPASAIPSSQLAGRPRLVAKTANLLQQNAKSFKPAAPDPMQVWNKNRVTPQPSTKHLTDEELKQQYGIHLTSRLEADGDGKEAKWADIDDDEDDWAPETIEWNDGTKTTLTAADLTSVTPIPKPDAQTVGPVSVVIDRPKPPQFTSSVGPNATVLKLGASAEKQQAQKAAAEKTRTPLDHASRSTSSNVTPAAAPVKSPWAPLPPVDKASPIEINPQPMMPVNRAVNPYGMGQPPHAMHAPSPAKEISADDFNRTWKDGSSMQPRELYMPNSGRYEAVSDGRRRLSRNEQGFRAPAVLQRPSANDIQGPAEPSAAFQTTRTSSDATRRRASSIVSGTSGQLARRLSMKSGDYGAPVFDNQSSDLAARPGSQDGPVTPLEAPPQTNAAANPAQPSAGAPGYDLEAERERQKQMMKENSARARQRRQEEEARLEAEKKERIRKKLEALEAVQPVKAESAVIKETIEQAPVLEAPRMVQSASQSPPKPPQPLATGEPQQYGMIKVHALDSTKRLSTDQQRPFPSREGPMPGSNGIRPIDPQRPAATDQALSSEPSPKLPKTLVSDARSGWGDLRDHRPQGANLWGISSNKALGNGTFDQTLAGYAPQDLSRTPSGAPGWNGRTPVAGRSPHIQEAKLPLASPDQGPLAADSEADTLFPVVPPAPIGRPQHQSSPLGGGQSGTTGNSLAAWQNFHQTATIQERAENERHQRDLVARREEEQRTGIRQGPQYTFNETWKQVQVGDQPSQRQVAGKTQSAIPAAFGAVGSLPNGPTSRGSRFFPTTGQSQAPEERRAVTYSFPSIPRSPSPPPAEEYASAHPAFDGSLDRPAVRFPREKAVVRLPPAGPPTPPAEPEEDKATLTWAARAAMATQPQIRSTSMPVGQNLKWQERFNGLFKTPPVEIESSSRDSSDVVPTIKDYSVSLPMRVGVQEVARMALQMTVQPPSYATKDVEKEEDLFEDRELASLPTISLPLQPLVHLPLASRPHIIYSNPLDISSGELFNTNNSTPYRAQFTLIHMPGTTQVIKKDLPSNTHLTASKPRNQHGQFRRPYGPRGRGRGTAKVA